MSEAAFRWRSATPALPVGDLAVSIAFYDQVCGFGVLARGEGFALLGRDGVSVVLWTADDADWRGRAGDRPVVSGAESFLAGTASCRLQVEGIDALHARAQTAGAVHPNGPLRRAAYPAREFDMLDPDGNQLTAYEPLAEG
ncbi:MAG: VOC family protein [Pseudomonadota bacterium]